MTAALWNELRSTLKCPTRVQRQTRSWPWDELEAVVVSSVPALHYSQAKAALTRGCHVLIEKPMTITSSEAEELVALADAHNLQFILGATWHYTPHSVEARRLVQTGQLGRIKMISILMTNLTERLYRGQSLAETVRGADDEQRVEFQPPLIEPMANSYSDPKLAGGGQIYCQTSHPGAYLSFLTERQPLEVFARFENDGAQSTFTTQFILRSMTAHWCRWPQTERPRRKKCITKFGFLARQVF